MRSAALAMVVIDNPMCPGHRASHLQRLHEGLYLPEAQTRSTSRRSKPACSPDVLKMPYGVEIYSLLTRWNPLNVKRPYALPYNGKKVLVVGLGPAGYTLAHYLLNEGFGVVGIDGLKIEPLPAELTGANGQLPRSRCAIGRRCTNNSTSACWKASGGVSEYGITVRWDKNFLTLLHLTLAGAIICGSMAACASAAR